MDDATPTQARSPQAAEPSLGRTLWRGFRMRCPALR